VTPSAELIASNAQWRLRRRVRLRWRDWGGDSVVFDLRSGQTFQFPPLTASVLSYLEEAPRDTPSLVAALAADLDCAVDADLCEAVAASLRHLHLVGWVASSDIA